MKSIKKIISLGGFTNSKEFMSHPFWLLREDKHILDVHLRKLVMRLKDAGVEDSGIKLFKEAFYYFMDNPSHYDGNSGDEELLKIDGYKYGIGLVHDFLDMPSVNFTTTFKRFAISDAIFIKMCYQAGLSSWNIEKRKFLVILRPLRYLLSWKRRNNNPSTKDALESLITRYSNNYKIDYQNTFNIIGWALFLVIAFYISFIL
jgi:hypothetical protein